MNHSIAVDEGTEYYDVFEKLLIVYNSDALRIGTEVHNSLGVGERYRDPRRKKVP